MSQTTIEVMMREPLHNAPVRFRVLPWGLVHTSKGDFRVDAEAARQVVTAFRARGLDLPVDWEHTSQGGNYARPDRRSPAAGWVKDLEIVEGEGVYVLVDWTDEGRRDVTSRAYRYYSPVILLDSTRRPTRIKSVALTNLPATERLEPLVAKDDVGPDAPPRTERKALILKASAEYDEAGHAVQLLCDRRSWINEALRARGRGNVTEDEFETVLLSQ